MTTITLEEAQAKLPELIGKLVKGEELTITQGDRVVAKLVGERVAPLQRPDPGLGRDMIAYMAPDFDAPLEEFEESME
jgi:antitoxin (DNA-binding transcriptional repressor) of toxin-antitoxin stability system